MTSVSRRLDWPFPMTPEIRNELLACVPALRAFAISLAGSIDRADDLVQEALTRAIANIHRFTPGTSLQAWLFTILRNFFYTEERKRRREIEDPEGGMASRLAVLPEQQGRLEFQDLLTALAKLSDEQRETLLLVGTHGISYEDAAKITGVPVGTVKSRVNRARVRLAELMRLHDQDDIAPDRVMRAAQNATQPTARSRPIASVSTMTSLMGMDEGAGITVPRE